MPENARERWLQLIRSSLDEGTFVKLTLSKPRERKAELRNVYARIVELRSGRLLSLTLRHATKDTTRNVSFGEGIAQLGSLLSDAFEEGHLFTTARDWKLKADSKGQGTVKGSRPVFQAVLSTTHDRPKQKALDHAPFLTRLGVTDAEGAARVGMADKLRQIERFVEILGHLVEDSPLHDAKSVTACDMGAGKGYLTFAAHEFFRRRGAVANMTGVELRDALVQQTNSLAVELGHEGLRFAKGAIGDFELPESLDLLIALHACDTATDEAIARAVRGGAKLLLSVPCCHHALNAELRPDGPAEVLRPLLRHGILRERAADLVTDAFRALALRIMGYRTDVVEFVSTEHTARNLMIRAVRGLPVGESAFVREYVAMKEFFGVTPTIESALGEPFQRHFRPA